jgi:hypothetical protein
MKSVFQKIFYMEIAQPCARYEMFAPLRRATLFALYQMSVLTGIFLLPVALVARRAGVPFPMHHVMQTIAKAYEEAAESSA